MIRFAEKSDIPALIALWKELYGDPDSYIRLFFEKRFEAVNSVVLELDDEICGVMYLLPCKLFPDVLAQYWYAGGISEKARNQGHFRQLIEFILEISKEKGIANLCVPATGLFPFYRKMGLTHEFKVINQTIDFNKIPTAKIEKQAIEFAKPAHFFDFSDTPGSTVWSVKDIEYAFLENEASGGAEIIIPFEGREYPAFLVRIDADEKALQNTLLPTEALKQVASKLMETYPCKRITLQKFAELNSSCPPDSCLTLGLSDCNLVNSESRLLFPMI